LSCAGTHFKTVHIYDNIESNNHHSFNQQLNKIKNFLIQPAAGKNEERSVISKSLPLIFQGAWSVIIEWL
jgi:hypothetical protein